MKRIITALLLAILTAAVGLSAQGIKLAHASGPNIDTIAAWDGSSYVQSFGVPNTATYGQTITAPAAPTNRLTDFSFEMNLPSSTVFRGEVYAWNSGTSMATGPSLFESASMSTTGTGWQKVTFTIPGGVTLTPGAQYVLFASVSKDYSSSGTGSWGQTQYTDTYSGGQFVYLNNGGDPTGWTTSPWITCYLGCAGDLAFQANFGPAGNCTNVLPGPGFFTPILSNGGNTVTIGQKDANGYDNNAYTTTNIGSATNSASPGQNYPFNNVFTKAVPGVRATVKIVATDDAGCTATFDPTFTSSVRSDGAPVTDTYTGILASENTVAITNGTPGVSTMTITVNGHAFKVTGMKAGESRAVTIGSALSGDNNTVTVTSTGKPGGSAFLLIGPGQ